MNIDYSLFPSSVKDAPLRVLYLGTRGVFSLGPLLALLDAAITLCGVVVPGSGPAAIGQLLPERRSPLPLANPYLARSIVHSAWERQLPVFEVSKIGVPEFGRLLMELRPDIACVACFPWRIPRTLLALPRLGWLNLHPSLLPAHRGPAPLFWTFRAGESDTGLTVHLMDENLDTGDILAQTRLKLPDGITGPEADALCGELGGQLLATAAAALAAGTALGRPQPAGGGYEPWPPEQAFSIHAGWSARRVFNFIRGTAEWGRPFLLELNGQRLALSTALRYEDSGELGMAYVRRGRELAIQCTPGIVWARGAEVY